MKNIVIALHSNGGGKNGKHAAVPSVSNVTSISYASVQVCTVNISANYNHIDHFFHEPISTNQLLCRLMVGPQMRNNNIELHIDDASKKLEAMMKLFVKQGKSKVRRQRPQEIQRTTSYILAEFFIDLRLLVTRSHESPRQSIRTILAEF
jgi:hypothetical protein